MIVVIAIIMFMAGFGFGVFWGLQVAHDAIYQNKGLRKAGKNYRLYEEGGNECH